jgi:hypothetical protein
MVMHVQKWIRTKLRRLVPIVAVVALLGGGVVTVGITTAEPALASGGCGQQSVLLSGTDWLGGNGVDVCNNGGVDNDWGSSCVSVSGAPGDSNCPAGKIYAGEEWQCVELVNRLYLTNGWITTTWWGNGDQLYSNAPSGLTREAQGSITTISPGDVISFGDSTTGTGNDDGGHAAVVASVSGSSITIVNQNAQQVYSYATLSGGTLTMTGWAGYYIIGVIEAPGGSSGGGSTPTATAARPAPVQYGGEMDVYVIGGDGYLYKDTYGSGWSGFSKLSGGNLVGSPMAMAYTNGSYSEMDVFAVGSDGTVSKDTWNGSVWTFGNLGKPSNTNLVGNPMAMEWTNGSYQELDVYVTGADGNVYKDTWNGSTWSTFTPLGTGNSFVSSPTAVQYGSEMDVYVRSSNNVVYKDTWTTTWSGWNPLGTMTMQHEPFAMVYTNGGYSEMDIYSIATSGNQPEKDMWNGQTWSNWNGLSGGSLGTPYAMEYTEGSYQEMDVYLRGANNVIYHDSWNGSTWSGWGNLGTSGFASEPSAVEYTNGSYQEMDVFATTSGGAVYKDTWNGQTWSGWNPLP